MMPSSQDPLRFIHISDTHIHPELTYRESYSSYPPLLGAQALVQAVNQLPFMPDFILHTGDVAYNPVAGIYDTVRDVLGNLKAPVHYLVGNHDDSPALQRELVGIAEPKPFYAYEFEAKGVQIVCLDSNGEHNPKNPSGFVPQEQLDWLDTICSSDDDRPLVIAVHHNPIPCGTPWLDDWMRIENGEDLHAIVRQARDRLRGVFYGHIHQNLEVLRDGVLYSACASSWCQFLSYTTPDNKTFMPEHDTLPGFSVVTISDTGTTIRRHTFPIPQT